jgi:hypothetical protein
MTRVEAVSEVDNLLGEMLRNNTDFIKLIVGQGNHSRNNIAILPSHVEKHIQDNWSHQFTTYIPDYNPGVIRVTRIWR